MVSGSRVLIVDDDPVSVLMAQFVLESVGHTVTTALDAPDARSKIAAADSTFDVIVSDYNMPGESGLDLLESLDDRSGSFILLTGVAEAAEFADERVALVDGFLTKPVQSDELIQVVAQTATA